KLKNLRNPTPNLEDENLWTFNYQLGDSPFGVILRRLAPAFSIVVLWVIGRHGTASRNFSPMRRLLPFSADLILSFRAQHTRTKGEVRPFGDPQAFISSFFSAFSFLFAT
ncbi:hypothetical protein MTR67_031089, partial [Solanum verrucosum]